MGYSKVAAIARRRRAVSRNHICFALSGYHLVEKKNAVTTDATVPIATQVAGSAISAFQAMLEIMLVLLLSIDTRRQRSAGICRRVADSESKLEARFWS